MSKVIIIDYGSQVTQLIARRVREAGVYSEIHPCVITAEQVAGHEARRRHSVGRAGQRRGKRRPDPGQGVAGTGRAGTGHLLRHAAHGPALGGELARSETREYGPADFQCCAPSPLWEGVETPGGSTRVWMSHGDKVKTPPPGFAVTGRTATLEVAAMKDEARRLYSFAFHPEYRTPRG